MADLYVDTDGGGSNTSPYDTWAKSTSSLDTALGAASAGDRIFMQGATADNYASTNNFVSPGTDKNPCFIVGVKDGTTNEPAQVSDLAIRGTDTLTSVTGDDRFRFHGGAQYFGLRFAPNSYIENQLAPNQFTTVFRGCFLDCGNNIRWGQDCDFIVIDCETSMPNSAAIGNADTKSNMLWYGGTFTSNHSSILRSSSEYLFEFYGVDMSDVPSGFNLGGTAATDRMKMRIVNCKLHATHSLFSTLPTTNYSYIQVIQSNAASSIGDTDSIQDYEYEDAYGTIDLDTTHVRTGGADDSASGQFAYAMVPHTDAVKEGTGAALKSPWMSVWVEGGSEKTFTVYIANDDADSAANDLHEDEVELELFSPAETDSAQHDFNIDPSSLGRLLDENSTSVTDDTGSTWGTGANNHQKLSVTVTPGHTGVVYGRLLYRKRTSPPTLYLDPKIEVS